MIDTNSEDYKKFVKITQARSRIELAGFDFVEEYFTEKQREDLNKILASDPHAHTWIALVLVMATQMANDAFHKLHIDSASVKEN